MTVRIIQGDCRDVLRSLEAGSVQTCVTSPPYFGLRDYGTASWEGGDPNHNHDRIMARNGRGGSGSPGKQTPGSFPSDLPAPICSCGAKRIDSQIGLEPTPAAYVAQLVDVFREVRRVLRDDGTLWLNLGDSYASTGCHSAQGASSVRVGRQNIEIQNSVRGFAGKTGGLKPKDLIGIPWRVAFALQEDGWYLRQDIIWAKPNPMPESVKDRCTKSHEYLFLLSKSPRYYFDGDAIAEPITCDRMRGSGPMVQPGTGRNDVGSSGDYRSKSGNKERKPASARGVPVDTNGKTSGAVAGSIPWEGTTRNKRSVWTVGTQPFAEAHFATFPPDLIEPCILAGCPKGGVVLDPFGGAGTTAMVADRHGRDAISIELNPEYVEMQRRRLVKDGGMFTELAAE